MLVLVPMILTVNILISSLSSKLQTLLAMKFSIIIPSLALISSTVTAFALPNEQDLANRDNEVPKLNTACLARCDLNTKSVQECRKLCT